MKRKTGTRRSIKVLIVASVISCITIPSTRGAEDRTNARWTPVCSGKIVVAARGGGIIGDAFYFAIPEPGDVMGFTQCVQVVYLPQQRISWAGTLEEANLVFLEGRLFGFAQNRWSSEMRVLVSTNQRPNRKAADVSLFSSELAPFVAGPKTNFVAQRYTIDTDRIVGRNQLQLPRTRVADAWVFSTNQPPSRIMSLQLSGTNVVVTTHYSQGILTIAFDVNLYPVWATTNGVSIGPIPTNCVFYSDIVSNKLVTKVVY